ncbi:hypothetical protein, partial [Limnohabitans sp.]
ASIRAVGGRSLALLTRRVVVVFVVIAYPSNDARARAPAPAGAGMFAGVCRRFNAPNACTALRVAPGMLLALDRR